MAIAEREEKSIEKDITEKLLEDYDDVFADIVNGLLFEGRQVVLPEQLGEGYGHSQYKAEDGRIHEIERDVAKYWKKSGTIIALCGIENQSQAERLMPLRILGYDGAAYRSQIVAGVKRPYPVVTIVLYFGEKHWNYPKNLKSLIDINAEMEPYVNDYKMHVFEVSFLTEEQISRFQSDFRIVANFFVNKRKDKDYVPDDPTEIQHVDEVLKLLSVMSRDNRYEEILSQKEEVKTMCEVADRLWNRGREVGITEGRIEGKIEGKIEGESLLASLMSILLSKGRIEDAKKASESVIERQRLYREYGLQ